MQSNNTPSNINTKSHGQMSEEVSHLVNVVYEKCRKRFSFLENDRGMTCINKGISYNEIVIEYKNDELEIDVIVPINVIPHSPVSEGIPEIMLINIITPQSAGLFFLYRHLCDIKSQWKSFTAGENIDSVLNCYADFLKNRWNEIMDCDWKKQGRMSTEELKQSQLETDQKIHEKLKEKYSARICNFCKRCGIRSEDIQLFFKLQKQCTFRTLSEIWCLLKEEKKLIDTTNIVTIKQKTKRALLREKFTEILDAISTDLYPTPIKEFINTMREKNACINEEVARIFDNVIITFSIDELVFRLIRDRSCWSLEIRKTFEKSERWIDSTVFYSQINKCQITGDDLSIILKWFASNLDNLKNKNN